MFKKNNNYDYFSLCVNFQNWEFVWIKHPVYSYKLQYDCDSGTQNQS